MGPSPVERVRYPRATGLTPEDLALSKTLRQFPDVRAVSCSTTTSTEATSVTSLRSGYDDDDRRGSPTRSG